MFLESFQTPAGPALAPSRTADPQRFGVDSEYGRLQSVLLADPRHLDLVPCNSVSREAVRDGRTLRLDRAAAQHAALTTALRDEGVAIHKVPADPGLPDLAFTRDTSLMTPWGLLGLRPGASHRAREVDVVLETARAVGVKPLGRIEEGRIEGGDVLLLRPGLILIGISGERTDETGAAALGALFRAKGWRVLTHRFDPHFLHLDTLLCLADRNLAMACADVLDEMLLKQLEGLGIDLIPVAYKEARKLGCNLLSLGRRRVLTEGSCTRLNVELARRDYRAISVDLSEFTLCGGGVHCLTMPLGRAAG
jgi:arginine deiminase